MGSNWILHVAYIAINLMKNHKKNLQITCNRIAYTSMNAVYTYFVVDN